MNLLVCVFSSHLPSVEMWKQVQYIHGVFHCHVMFITLNCHMFFFFTYQVSGKFIKCVLFFLFPSFHVLWGSVTELVSDNETQNKEEVKFLEVNEQDRSDTDSACLCTLALILQTKNLKTTRMLFCTRKWYNVYI